MPQKGEDQTKTGILIGKIAVEGGQGLTGEDEAGVLGQPGVQEGSLLRLRAELGQAAGGLLLPGGEGQPVAPLPEEQGGLLGADGPEGAVELIRQMNL